MTNMKNPYQQARFMKSVPRLDLAPSDHGAEVAFAGRSNAGKSSAINCITAQKSLARTSKTPGRTQHLVFFLVQGAIRLVDLPGYGFARVPDKVRQGWQRLMQSYFEQRQSLRGLVLVMDIRHPLTEFDRMMLDWCQFNELPTHVLLTKADKLKRGAAQNTLLSVQRTLSNHYPIAEAQIFSALKQTGVETVRKQMDQWLGLDQD